MHKIKYILGPISIISLNHPDNGNTIYLFGDDHDNNYEISYDDNTITLCELLDMLLVNSSKIHNFYIEQQPRLMNKKFICNSSLFNNLYQNYNNNWKLLSNIIWNPIDIRNENIDVFGENNVLNKIESVQGKCELKNIEIYEKYLSIKQQIYSNKDDIKIYEKLTEVLNELINIVENYSNIYNDKLLILYLKRIKSYKLSCIDNLGKILKIVDNIFNKFTIIEIDDDIKDYIGTWLYSSCINEFTQKIELLSSIMKKYYNIEVETRAEKNIINNYMNDFIGENFDELQMICKNIVNTNKGSIVTNFYGIFNHCMTDYFSIFMDIYTVGLINKNFGLNQSSDNLSIIIAGNSHINNYKQYFINNGYNITHLDNNSESIVLFDNNMIKKVWI